MKILNIYQYNEEYEAFVELEIDKKIYVLSFQAPPQIALESDQTRKHKEELERQATMTVGRYLSQKLMKEYKALDNLSK